MGLTVTRSHDSAGILRRMKVRVDGRTVGGLRPGESLTVEVDEGVHTVQGAMDSARSPVLRTSGLDPSPITLSFGFAGGFLRTFTDPGNAISIRQG